MDRVVLIVVALALLVATQAQADDPWFNVHCEESREIVASVQSQARDSSRDVAPAQIQESSAGIQRESRPVRIKARKARKSRA